MCRRCGEPDRRPGAARRRQLTKRLLEIHGNGVICPCWLCDGLLGAQPGYLTVTDPDGKVRRLKIQKLERDRLEPGGPYSLWNLMPACGPCNRARTYDTREIPDGCDYGPGLPREVIA